MLFIITEYFYPFIDGGGPLRSIEGLANCLDCDFKIITSSKSYSGDLLPAKYKVNAFQINLKIGKSIAYISKSISGLLFLYKSIEEYDVVYVNGLFMPSLNLIPILISNRVIISPRGMLHEELLLQKKWSKWFYLSLLKSVLFFKK